MNVLLLNAGSSSLKCTLMRSESRCRCPGHSRLGRRYGDLPVHRAGPGKTCGDSRLARLRRGGNAVSRRSHRSQPDGPPRQTRYRCCRSPHRSWWTFYDARSSSRRKSKRGLRALTDLRRSTTRRAWKRSRSRNVNCPACRMSRCSTRRFTPRCLRRPGITPCQISGHTIGESAGTDFMALATLTAVAERLRCLSSPQKKCG